MSEPEAASTQAALDALKALEEDAPELERIENLLDRFNVYEVIGFVGQEVMHSRFLAFLLDPTQNHGLGNLFLKGFLRKVSESNDKVSLPQILDNADEGSLDQTVVQTEVYTDDGRIDILLLNEVGEWSMIVENKVWSAEHSDQLGRYYRFVRKAYPGWRVFGVYLMPFSSLPSRAEDRQNYRPLSYGAVCDLVDRVLEHRGSELGLDVRVAMEHYADMVRRHIVDDPEVTRLCRSIYRKHKKAFDLVYEKNFNQQAVDRAILINLVEDTEGLILTGSSKTYVWFHPEGWEVPALSVNDDPSGFLRFVFFKPRDRLELFLETSPGDEEVRRKLFELGQKDPTLFNHLEDPATNKYSKLYRRTFLTPEFLKDASDSEREHEIGKRWEAFLAEDLPRIEEALKNEAWIWESEEPDGDRSGEGSRFVWGEGDIVITKRPQDEE